MQGVNRIISTKKLLPNQKQFLLNAGLSVVEADFIEVVFTGFSLDNVNENLIFTSQNSVKSFLAKAGYNSYADRKVFCVGSKTRELLEISGFRVVESADYAEELAKTITNNYSHEEFTFFCGSMRRDTLPNAFRAAGISFKEVEVYKTVLVPKRLEIAADGILFFSPSGVKSFLNGNTVKGAVCFCIGTTTAQALEGIADTVIVANRPTVENVVIQCINYYNNTRRV